MDCKPVVALPVLSLSILYWPAQPSVAHKALILRFVLCRLRHECVVLLIQGSHPPSLLSYFGAELLAVSQY